MMKMRREEFYAILLNETINKPGFNHNFLAQTNQYNVTKKKEMVSLIYEKLRVSQGEYGKKFEVVSKCPERVIHHVFERLLKEALKAREKGLIGKINQEPKLTDFQRHLGALDGGRWYDIAGYKH